LLQRIGGANPLLRLWGKLQIEQASFLIFLQALHRRGVAVLEPGDQGATPSQAFLITVRVEDLLDQALQLGLELPGHLGLETIWPPITSQNRSSMSRVDSPCTYIPTTNFSSAPGVAAKLCASREQNGSWVARSWGSCTGSGR